MFALLCFVLGVLASPFKSKSGLEAENAALRHQLIILRRKVPGRVRLTNNDRWFFIQLYRSFPSILQVLTIIHPETLVRWHRAGFRCYWRWKSRSLGGRPQIETDLRALIRRMSIENPLWGAPRIHGELLRLGFEVAQSSVAKYMVKRHGPLRQGWRTRLDRRDLVWVNVRIEQIKADGRDNEQVATMALIRFDGAGAVLKHRPYLESGKLARTWRRSSSGSVIPSEARTTSR